jgi:hypothetical protein
MEPGEYWLVMAPLSGVNHLGGWAASDSSLGILVRGSDTGQWIYRNQELLGI